MMTRFLIGSALFAASVLLVAPRPTEAWAQGKDGKKELSPLERQLQSAQLDLVKAGQQIAALRQEVNQLQAANNKLKGNLKKEAKEDAKDEKTIKSLQTTIDGFRGAGIVHVVVLKAKDDTAKADVQSLIDESYSQLTKIKTVRGLWAGKPAGNSTPGSSTDYTVALVLLFDDAVGLKNYLGDPVHTKFTDKHLKKWETPLVYDFEPKKVKP